MAAPAGMLPETGCRRYGGSETSPPRSCRRRARSASLARRIARPGRPTTTASSGSVAPGGTSVPSPRMQPRPRRAPASRMDPFPISHRSPTAAPITTQRCPKTTFWPIETGCSAVPMAIPFSRRADPAPSSTAPPGVRITAPCAMWHPGPARKSPSTAPLGATRGESAAGLRLRLIGPDHNRPAPAAELPRCCQNDRTTEDTEVTEVLTASGRRLARDRRPDLVSVLSVSSVVQSFLRRFRLDGGFGGEGEGEAVDQTFGDGAGLGSELGDRGALPQLAAPQRAQCEEQTAGASQQGAVAVGGKTHPQRVGPREALREERSDQRMAHVGQGRGGTRAVH